MKLAKTADNWINLVWSASIYYPDVKESYLWSDAADFILGIYGCDSLIDYDDSIYGTADTAFCQRPENYIPRFSKETFWIIDKMIENPMYLFEEPK